MCVVLLIEADECDFYIEQLHDPQTAWLKHRTASYNDTSQI
jgi:hypothetical protein